jgi:hypothetical protein
MSTKTWTETRETGRQKSSSARTISLYRRLSQIPMSSSTSATKVDGEATAIETKAKMQDQPVSNLEIGSIEDLLTAKIDDAILHAQGHEAAMPRTFPFLVLPGPRLQHH